MSTIKPYQGIAEVYDLIRPSYPDQLIDDIIMLANLNPAKHILEIGAGTGKATIPFLKRGYAVHAIELGEDMARILREKCAEYPKLAS